VLAYSKDPANKRLPDHVPNPCVVEGMSSSTAGKHAGSGAASNQPAVAEPTFAERARTLVYLGRVGSLSTLSSSKSMNCSRGTPDSITVSSVRCETDQPLLCRDDIFDGLDLHNGIICLLKMSYFATIDTSNRKRDSAEGTGCIDSRRASSGRRQDLTLEIFKAIRVASMSSELVLEVKQIGGASAELTCYLRQLQQSYVLSQSGGGFMQAVCLQSWKKTVPV
jgi:hypothetical protein